MTEKTRYGYRWPQLALLAVAGCIFHASNLYAEFLVDAPASSQTSLISNIEVAPQVKVPVVFELSEHVSVSTSRLYLASIATCRGFGIICDESYAIDLGATPAPGQSMRLVSHRVSQVLQKEFPSADIAVIGAETVIVTSQAQDVDSDWIVSELQSLIDRHLESVNNVRAKVVSVRMLRGVRLRPGDYTVLFPDIVIQANDNFDWLLNLHRGASSLRVVLRSENSGTPGGAIESNVHAQVVVEQRIPVATKNLEVGELLSNSHFELSWVRLPRTYISYAASFSDLTGMKLRRRVAAGEPVNVQQISLPRAVRRGESVHVSIKGRGMELQAKGRALSSGAIGERVEIEYQHTRRRLNAQVTGPGRVEVQM